MDIFSTNLTSNALISAVSSNVQEVLSNIAPILELIIGVVLAFVVARYLISLFKGTGSTSENSHTKSDLNMYHYSDIQMDHEGIDPMGISEFDEGSF